MKRARFAALLLSSLALVPACNNDSTSPDSGTTTTTVTDTFASRIQEKGSASRSFNVPTAGSVQIQLTALSQSGAVVALGFGTFSGTTCTITRTVNTAADGTTNAPQISADVAAGDYCVKISDVGNLTSLTDFTITITRPYA